MLKNKITDVTPCTPLNNISPSIANAELSTDHIASLFHLNSKENLSMRGENSPSTQKFSKKNLSIKSANKWFVNRFNQVLKKKEQPYKTTP